MMIPVMDAICKKLFQECKEKNIDILNLQREFEIRYPKKEMENPLQISDLEISAKVNIKITTDILDFK